MIAEVNCSASGLKRESKERNWGRTVEGEQETYKYKRVLLSFWIDCQDLVGIAEKRFRFHVS